MIAAVQVSVLIAAGVFGGPASPLPAAHPAPRPARPGRHRPRAGAPGRVTARPPRPGHGSRSPSARAETSAHVRFPPGVFQPPRGPGDPRQDPPFPPGRLDPLADRHPPSLPAVFRKLDAVAVLTARLLPAPAGVAGVIAGAGFQCVTRRGMLEGIISYRNDNGAWLNAAGDHAPAVATSAHSPGMDAEMTLCMALEDLWI